MVSTAAKVMETYQGVISCFIHTLQLAINYVFEKELYIEDIGIIHEILVKLKISRALRDQLRELLSNEDVNIVLPTDTRWNSTLHMLQCFLKKNWAIRQLFDSYPDVFVTRFPNISRVQNLCTVLEKFDDYTKIFSNEKEITISKVALSVKELLDYLEEDEADDDTTTLKNALRVEVDLRVGWILLRSNIYLKASALDPLYGSLFFIEDELRENVN